MNNSAQGTWEKYPAALPADTILAGQYIIVDVLGQGGFGITYLAEDYGTKTNVAVKEYFPEMMAMRSTASLEEKTVHTRTNVLTTLNSVWTVFSRRQESSHSFREIRIS